MSRAVLVVDDDPLILSVLRTVLEIEDYRVTTAESAHEALQHLEAHDPDLVITDIRMPDMDGFELTRRIRADVNGQRLPVVMLTARDEEADRVTGLEAGGDVYMTKPFSPLDLLTTIRDLLPERI